MLRPIFRRNEGRQDCILRLWGRRETQKEPCLVLLFFENETRDEARVGAGSVVYFSPLVSS